MTARTRDRAAPTVPGWRVVALGGGHGLAATLRAVRLYASRVTAIVSTADDGGSSGVLRRALGTVPPGDLRKCLLALGDPDSTWARAFEHRFEGGKGIEGHALGNLVIAGLEAVMGDLPSALEEAGRLVGAVGRVLPATEAPVVLRALAADRVVEGQAHVSRSARIRRIVLDPPDATVSPGVLEEITSADQILLGPGSLFTSVLAVATVAAIADALKTAPGRFIYICNLRPQVPETAGFDVAAHVNALLQHGIEPDVVVCDTSAMHLGDFSGTSEIPLPGPGGQPEAAVAGQPGFELVDADLSAAEGGHDPEKLAAVLEGLPSGADGSSRGKLVR